MLDHTVHHSPGVAVGGHVLVVADALRVLKVVLDAHSSAWLCAGGCGAIGGKRCLPSSLRAELTARSHLQLERRGVSMEIK